jgi:arabinofuranosyltransferase
MSSPPRQAPPLFSPAPERRGRDLTALSLAALTVICAIALIFQIHHFWFSIMWSDMRPPVEESSNLLWVLLCNGLSALGMKLETAARLLGTVSTVAGITAVAAQVYRDYPAKVRFLSALIACLSLALSAPVAVWSVGGLEQPLLAAFLAWAAYFGIRWTSSAKGKARDAHLIGVLLGLALLTRADAALFTLLFYAGAVLSDGVRPRTLISRTQLLPIPVLFFAGQELFRHAHYGAWLPNTAYTKVAFTLHGLYMGLHYEIFGAGAEFAFLVLTLIGCVALWIAGKKRQLIFLSTVCVGWLLYILFIGGDPLPAYRQLTPAIALMSFLVAGCGLLTLSAAFRFSRVRVVIFLILTLLVLTSDLVAVPGVKVEHGKSMIRR